MKPAVTVFFVGSLVLLAPGLAHAQHTANGSAGVGTAVPAGSTSSGGSSSSSSSGGSTSSGGGGDTGNFSSGGHRAANANHVPGTARSAIHSDGVFTNYSQLSGVPAFSRPRNGRPIIGTAVPRGSVAAPAAVGGGDDGLTYIYGTYNPWIYAYDGFGAVPLYGAYDPFDADFGLSGGGLVSSTSSDDHDGVLKLDVKPWNAEVYIDGDRAGTVDQFQGLFHKLRLEAGVHRVELRARAYQTLVVNVRIEPGGTITYRGALEKTAP